MKNFISPDGIFIMQIPLDWESISKVDGKSPYQFCLRKNPIGVLTLSCILISEDFNKKHPGISFQNQLADKENLDFFEKKIVTGKHEFIFWTAKVADHIFTISYNYKNQKKRQKYITNELNSIREILNSIMLIGFKDRSYYSNQERYKKFLIGLASAKDLENKAGNSGSFIEVVALLSNQIDALLRLAILLQKQIQDKSDEIDISLIYQISNEIPLSERGVYNKAMKNGIINGENCKRLHELYNERNKVIHRYILTDLRTEDILDIAIRYNLLRNIIDKKITELELSQYEQKIGIYGKGEHPHKTLEKDQELWIESMIKDKHGSISS